MPDRRPLPPFTRLEAALTRVPLAGRLVTKFHRQRKRFYEARNRRRDARTPSDLRNFERRVFSQFGEDGILAEIFDRVGDGARLAVEFGVETGAECNTRHLVETRGWSAVLIDGSARHVAAARGLYAGRPVRVFERFLTVENVLATLAEAGVPFELDLLSVDVDGNDYWMLREILTVHRPRVVAVEYNGRWPPPARWVMPYDSAHAWDGSVYFGASLQSLTDLGVSCGYRLVGCAAVGVNAFFVRSDQIGEHFPTSDRGAGYHYAAPLYAPGFGHPVRPPTNQPSR